LGLLGRRSIQQGTPAYKDKAQSNTKATKFHPHPAEAPNSKRIAVQKTESLNREGGEHPPSCLHIAVGADEPPSRSQRRPHFFSTLQWARSTHHGRTLQSSWSPVWSLLNGTAISLLASNFIFVLAPLNYDLYMRMVPDTVVAIGLNAGHFLLTNLLLENMKSACRDSGAEGRIVNVTSAGHTMTYPEGIRFDKIHDPSG